MSGKGEVASAAAQLAGSVLGIDTMMNAVTLAGAVVGATEWKDQVRLRKSIQSRLTKTISSNRTLKKSDLESAFDCLATTINNLRLNNDLARAAASRETLLAYVSKACPSDHPARKDPAGRACLDLLLREICDVVSNFIVHSPRYLPVISSKTVERVDELDARHSQLRQETLHISRQISDLNRSVDQLIPIIELYPVLSGAQRTIQRLEPSGAPFVGRESDMLAMKEAAAGGDYIVLVGEPMSGTTELAKRWLLQESDSPIYVLDCHSEDAYSIAVASLSVDLEHERSASLLEVLKDASHISILFDDVSNEEMLRRILFAIERTKAAGRGPYVVTCRFRPSKVVSDHLSVGALSSSATEELLKTLLPEGQAVDALAQATGGLPLLAIQAASYIAETGLAVDAYLELLHDQPLETLGATVSIDAAGPKTAAAVWESALVKADQSARVSTRIALGLLREVGHTWPVGLMEGALGFYLSGGDELGSKAQVKGWLSTMQRLVLLHESDGVVSGTAGLLEYAWASLRAEDHEAIHNCVLRVVQLASSAARSNLSSAIIGALAYALQIPFYTWQDGAPNLIGMATISLVNALYDADYPEAAVWLLSECLTTDASALSEDYERFLLGTLAITLIQEELPTAPAVAEAAFQAHMDAGEPASDTSRINIIMALLSWQQCDLASTERHLEAAESGLSALAEDDDQDMVEYNIARLKFQVLIASGRTQEGFVQLKRAARIAADSEWKIASEDLLVNSVEFLEAQGVAVPAWLLESGKEALMSAIERQGQTVPGHSVWYLAGARQSLVGEQNSIDGLQRWLETPIALPLDDKTNAIHNAFRIHVDIKRRLDASEDLAADLLVQRLAGAKDLPSENVFLEILALVEKGLSLVEPIAALEIGWRAKRLRAMFWHHKGSCYQLMGQNARAREWLDQVYTFDLTEYGANHSEVAYDAMALFNAWALDDPRTAAKWSAIAWRIFDSAGRHRDASKAMLLKFFSPKSN